MEKRLTFNEDEINYDQYRPTYPDNLYEKIFSYCNLNSDSRLLEIGIGTGQATEPFLKSGCNVTAVELGDRLSAFVADKYSDYKNFSVINTDFMNYSLNSDAYDLIYSATAFHWLPAPEKYNKVMSCLKSGGVLALFWNHPFPNRENDKTNIASKAIYDKYRSSDKRQIEFCEDECIKYADELKIYGFTDVKYYLFHRVRTLSTEEYLHLMNTYSDHRTLEPSIKTCFENEMRQAINNVGGKINIYDTIDLYLAKKP